jgi:hypothetical protein
MHELIIKVFANDLYYLKIKEVKHSLFSVSWLFVVCVSQTRDTSKK